MAEVRNEEIPPCNFSTNLMVMKKCVALNIFCILGAPILVLPSLHWIHTKNTKKITAKIFNICIDAIFDTLDLN